MGLEVPSIIDAETRLQITSLAESRVAVREAYTSARTSHADLVMESLIAPYKESLKDALQQHEFNFVITDPRLPDHPIVYASDGFLEMTGYAAEEVLGRNCRFLQGPDTDRRTILEIRDAIREEKACQVTILNYTKQGHPFWNLFHMAPVFSKDDGRVVHFVGVQTPVSNCVVSSVIDRSINSCTSEAQPLPDANFCKPRESTENAEASAVIGSCCLSNLPNKDFVEDNVSNQGANNVIDTRAEDDKDWVEEDNVEVQQADKERSGSCVRSLLRELAESSKCKGVGVTETRCTTVATCPGEERVVSSSLMLSLTKVQQSFVLANPHLPDMPIVHASELFLHLTGYSRDEVVGRNCRFLQGPNTDLKAVQQIRESLNAEQPCTVRILNYRKDKTPFWNFLHIAPVRSSGGKVAFFVGLQLDVTSADEDSCLDNGMTPHIKQLGAVGAIRVAVRSLQGQGLRRVQKSS
uniref:Putative LOV domain-containing protein n=1 Tax=Osmunda sp. BC-2016 TaxID=1799607 RepID=A0A126X2F9_9MONI|nr:putative LOV domain-containing protein [Osmunda sp. BC-2016]